MLKKFDFVDLSDASETENMSQKQQDAVAALPKIEEFCRENKLSIYDLECLVDILRVKVMATAF